MPAATVQPSTKHTPGPWSMRNTGDRKRILINEGYVAEVYSDDIERPEAEANAALIAAAPDLLAALKEALLWVEPIMVNNEDVLTQRQLRADLERARAAILKAEG